MQKYYYNDGANRFGPFTIEELQAKNISADTPIWYDGMSNWVKAGELEELKSILNRAATAIIFNTEQSKPAEEVKQEIKEAIPTPATVSTTEATVTTSVSEVKPADASSVKKTIAGSAAKKSTAWISWVLGLAVLGGTGYFIYQDMEKNKKTESGQSTSALSADSTSLQQYVDETSQNNNAEANPQGEDSTVATTDMTIPEQSQDNSNLTLPPPVAVPPKNNTRQPSNTKTTATTAKAQQAEAQKLAQLKAEEEKRQQAAALAALAKEKDYRNNWTKYITTGKLDFKFKDDDGGIDPFNVPVYNNTNAMLDKVIVRIDYWKKDKKVVHSETVTVYNIPAGSVLNGKAAGYKKGNNAKAIITGITARKIHLCYPGNSYAPDDPFYCN
jgi:hypothetical protein